MAAKLAVPVRLAPEVIEKARGYAESRGVSRQVVYESAILQFLADSERGIEALVVPVRKSRPAKADEAREAERRGREAWAAAMSARQAKLNADKDRGSR